jgi:hypothetical protein
MARCEYGPTLAAPRLRPGANANVATAGVPAALSSVRAVLVVKNSLGALACVALRAPVKDDSFF